jgi:hypothetical protein
VHCILFVVFLPDPPPAEIPTQPEDCFGDAWRELGFSNRIQCLILVSLVPDGDGGNGHDGHHKGGGFSGHRLISSVRPETSGGTAALAVLAAMSMFAVGAALPVRRRRF